MPFFLILKIKRNTLDILKKILIKLFNFFQVILVTNPHLVGLVTQSVHILYPLQLIKIQHLHVILKIL